MFLAYCCSAQRLERVQVRLQALQGWSALIATLTQHARPDLVTVANQARFSFPGPLAR